MGSIINKIKMKILHINFTDQGGGAAIAAYRHHEAMRVNGYDSRMLVEYKRSLDPNVIEISKSPIKAMYFKLRNKLIQVFGNYYAAWSCNIFGYDISKEQPIIEADIIILHWINGYTLSIKSLEKILKLGKPVYWFMHDMWPITGGCHHSLDCSKYKIHCEACPMTRNGDGSLIKTDLSWKQFEEKRQRLTPYENLMFLTPSQWLADKVKESPLFNMNSVNVIRNVLNTNQFKPVDKKFARQRLGLPLDKKLLLFGADNINSPYKGWNLLRLALKEPIDNVEAVVYGKIKDDIQKDISVKLHILGHISQLNKLIDLYSACDLFITPSLADNYPNVLIEAMACGLPCIGTNIGGIPEIIKDGINGKLISCNNAKDIRASIIDIINKDNEYMHKMRNNAVAQIRSINSYESNGWPSLINTAKHIKFKRR